MSDLETWRAAVSGWLDEHAPRSLWHTATSPFQGHWGGRSAEFTDPDVRAWFEACLARGWTAPSWPTEYGGGGLDRDRARVLSEELEARGLPLPLVGFGLTMLGPILLACGSEAQKAAHLPPIIRGEIRWCQGYSEPGSGSDLASLSCRAAREGDEYIVDGQKIWTSHADASDWIFCLVRTNPDVRKQAGISFLLIDMRSPGITTRPIQLISGASPFCETFFEGVRVPAENVVGGVDQGWAVAKSLLAHERTAVGRAFAGGGSRPPILRDFRLRDHAVACLGLTAGQLSDPLLRDEVARNEMAQACLELTAQRIHDAAAAGQRPGPESSVLKIVGAQVNQDRWDLATRIADLQGLGWEGEGYEAAEVAVTRTWLRSRANSIEGGTSEVQRNIIARHVLGLPKE
jgi:acyl-CoA dehydrogenase